MSWIDDFFAEFVPFAMAQLGIGDPPDGSINVLTAVQGIQHNFIAMLNGRAGAGWNLILPALFIDVGDFTNEEGSFGLNALQLDRAPITIVYMTDLGGPNGTQNYTYAQMVKLRKAIEARPSKFSTFTRVEEGALKSSWKAPMNSTLMGNSQGPSIASALIYQPGFLVQVY